MKKKRWIFLGLGVVLIIVIAVIAVTVSVNTAMNRLINREWGNAEIHFSNGDAYRLDEDSIVSLKEALSSAAYHFTMSGTDKVGGAITINIDDDKLLLVLDDYFVLEKGFFRSHTV